ncbi:hypothetical protein ACIQBJ_04980 [Kitasatospora sp. NPDC088391]|uniref:hypothetical protein n=1 Tax=Kitasatospora sp. NPDC088391 TaxID=3364074 RepID=UPI0038149010
MRAKNRPLLRNSFVRLLVLAMSAVGLTTLSAGASTAAVLPRTCHGPVVMPGEHYVYMGGSPAFAIELVYDDCKYATEAAILNLRSVPTRWWLAVDIADQNGQILHGDTRGYGTEYAAQTGYVSLNSGKVFQARGWLRLENGCSVFFDSDWHNYSNGADQGGGWNTSC